MWPSVMGDINWSPSIRDVLASLFVIKNAILFLADLGHSKAITVVAAAPAIMSNTQDELQSVYESLAYK